MMGNRRLIVMYLLLALCIVNTRICLAIDENRTLRIEGDASFAPYEFVNDKGEPDGFDIDLIKAIMHELGYKYELRLNSWPITVSKFERGEVDLIPGVTFHNPESHKYNLSNVVTLLYSNIVCRADSHIMGIRSLEGKTVVVLNGLTAITYMEHAKIDAHIVLSEDYSTELKLLSQGQYDAVICASEVAAYEIKHNKLNNLVLKTINMSPSEYNMAANNEELIIQVNHALNELQNNGTYDKIYDKWFGKKADDGRLYMIIGLSILALSVLAVVVRILKKRLDEGAAKIKDKNERLSLVMEASGISGWVYNIAEKQYYWLDKFGDIDEPISLERMKLAFHPEDFSQFMRSIDSMLSGRTDKIYTISRLKLHDDNYRYYEGHLRLKREGAKAVLITGTLKDITEMQMEQSRLREYKLKMSMAMKSAEIMQWDYDVRTQNVIVNNGHNVKDNTVVSAATYINNSQDLLKLFTLMNSGVDKKLKFDVAFKFIEEDRQRYSTVYAEPLERDNSGKVVRYTGLRKDVTELIDVQHKLQEEKEKAEQADKLKSAFLANMSHEIRTPLNSIVGFSDLLQTTEDADERAQYMEIINANTAHLLSLINDILDLSKIESGVFEIKPMEFDLSRVFDDIAESMKTKVHEAEVKIINDNPYDRCIVNLDKGRLCQVIANYVSNAIKYTPQGYIKMGYKVENGELYIYVEDTGIGIDKKYQNRMYQRFEKFDSYAQGTGLGLSIVKAIADRTGAEVGFSSEKDKGSTFWIKIPCDASPVVKGKP